MEFVPDVDSFLQKLPDDATSDQIYEVQVWHGKARAWFSQREKEVDRQKADESRRGANAATDRQGISRTQRTYSDGAQWANAFESRLRGRD